MGNLRLFEALPETELDMEQFNEGNFAKVGPDQTSTTEATLSRR